MVFDKIPQLVGDTENLKLFKKVAKDPDEEYELAQKRYVAFWNSLNVEETDYPDWVAVRGRETLTDVDGNSVEVERVIFLEEDNLKEIIAGLSWGQTPLFVGYFGTGKSTVAYYLLKWIFGREPVLTKIYDEMSTRELYGEEDILKIYGKLLAVVNSLSKSEMNTHAVIHKVDVILDSMRKTDMVFRNIGEAHVKNTGLIIDEIDKASESTRNKLSGVLQQIHRHIVLGNVGVIEFKQPTIAISNTEMLGDFVNSRVFKVKFNLLPPRLFEELLINKGVSNENIIKKVVEKYEHLYNEGKAFSVRTLIMEAQRLSIF